MQSQKTLIEELRNHENMIKRRNLEDYERILGIDITQIAKDSLKTHNRFLWYDMCCGEFAAGEELKKSFPLRFLTQPKIKSIGIDIDQTPRKIDKYTSIEKADAVSYNLPRNIDLITCVWGLPYIRHYQHREREAIENWYNSIRLGGVLTFNYENILPPQKICFDGLGSLGEIKIESMENVFDSLKEKLKDSIKIEPARYALASNGSSIVITKSSNTKLRI